MSQKINLIKIRLTKIRIKIGAICLLSLFFIFLLGCQGSAPSEQDFRTGFLDLTLKAEETNKVYQDKQFDLNILVHNLLGYNLENVVVSIVGLDETYVEVYSAQKNIAFLEGRSSLFESGGEERLLFETYIKSLPPGVIEEMKSLYRIFVKYDSEVILTEDVCVRPGLYSGIDDGGCTAKSSNTKLLQEGKNSLNGQGAPVGISEVEVISKRGQGLELRLKIENKGQGKVGAITLAEAAVGGKSLNCEFRKTGAGKQIIFDSPQKEISLVCTGLLGRESAYSYVTPLTLKFLYNYELSLQEELFILE